MDLHVRLRLVSGWFEDLTVPTLWWLALGLSTQVTATLFGSFGLVLLTMCTVVTVVINECTLNLGMHPRLARRVAVTLFLLSGWSLWFDTTREVIVASHGSISALILGLFVLVIFVTNTYMTMIWDSLVRLLSSSYNNKLRVHLLLVLALCLIAVPPLIADAVWVAHGAGWNRWLAGVGVGFASSVLAKTFFQKAVPRCPT